MKKGKPMPYPADEFDEMQNKIKSLEHKLRNYDTLVVEFLEMEEEIACFEKEVEILREATTSAYEAFQDQWNESIDVDKKEYFAEMEKKMLQALKQANKLKGHNE